MVLSPKNIMQHYQGTSNHSSTPQPARPWYGAYPPHAGPAGSLFHGWLPDHPQMSLAAEDSESTLKWGINQWVCCVGRSVSLWDTDPGSNGMELEGDLHMHRDTQKQMLQNSQRGTHVTYTGRTSYSKPQFYKDVHMMRTALMRVSFWVSCKNINELISTQLWT